MASPVLHPKHLLFLQAYLANGFNATAAAKTAGYKSKNAHAQASALLERPLIQERIRLALEQVGLDELLIKSKLLEIVRDGSNRDAQLRAIDLSMKLLGLGQRPADVPVVMPDIKISILPPALRPEMLNAAEGTYVRTYNDEDTPSHEVQVRTQKTHDDGGEELSPEQEEQLLPEDEGA